MQMQKQQSSAADQTTTSVLRAPEQQSTSMTQQTQSAQSTKRRLWAPKSIVLLNHLDQHTAQERLASSRDPKWHS